MVRYIAAWTPLVVVGTVALLTLPWLGLIALVILSFFAFAALASAIVFAPYVLGRAISRHWHSGSSARQPSAALSLAERKTA